MRKGQKSLEMIIGLVILLVVAAVVISMFLNIFQEPQIGQQTVERQKIEQTCSSLCQDWQESSGRASLSAAIEYCQRTFVFDSDDDGTTREIAGSGFNSYCENGVHCFNVQTCEAGFETLDYQKCRQLMCEYYTSVNGDPYDPRRERNVHDHIARLFSPQNEQTGVGTCNLADQQDSAGYTISNWYNQKDASFDLYQGDEAQGANATLVCEQRYNLTR